MKDAIARAIEGGWKCDGKDYESPDFIWDSFGKSIFLDPLFWQALGKAMGWPKHTEEVELDGFNLEAMSMGCSPTTKDIRYNWQYHWHRFIDHLAEGKDAESFFKELLK